MDNLELAKAYYDGDDEKHIKQDLDLCELYLERALKEDRNNPEIFYMFGLLYSENEDFEDYDKAIDNYEHAYHLGDKESALNLAMLFESTLEETIENQIEAVKWYLRYGDKSFLSNVSRIVDDICKNASNDRGSLKNAITAFKKFTFLTKDPSFLKVLYSKIDLLLEEYANKISEDIKGPKDIEEALNELEKFAKNPNVSDVIFHLKRKRFVLLEKNIKSIEDAVDLLDKAKTLEFDALEVNKLLKYIIQSLLNETNNASPNFDELMKYKRMYSGNTVFLDGYLMEKVYLLVKEEDFSVAQICAENLSSSDQQTYYLKMIEKAKEEQNFRLTNEKALTGDENAMMEVAKAYEEGIGTSQDKAKAFDAYVNAFNKHSNILAFEGAVRCAKYNFKDGCSVVAQMYNAAKKQDIILTSFLLKERERFFPVTVICGDTKMKMRGSRPEHHSFDKSSSEQIANMREELRKRGITKLIHFTPKRNVPSIMKHGILSRAEICSSDSIKEFEITDLNRLEGYFDSISVSVSWPNEFMLKDKIEKGMIKDPYIIEIDPSILLDENMRFRYYSSNAATRSIRDVTKGSKFSDFLNMFQPTYVSKDGVTYSRSALGRADNEPTDRQAEILVEGSIPAKYIMGEPIPWDEWKKQNSKRRSVFYGKKDDIYIY